MQATNRWWFTFSFASNARLFTLPWQFSGNSTSFKVANEQAQAIVSKLASSTSLVREFNFIHQQSKIRAHEKLLDKTRSVNDAYVRTQKHFATSMTNFQTQIQSQDSQLKQERSLNSAQKVTVASTRLQSYSTSCQQQFHEVMVSKLTHVKSPLVLVCSNGVDKLLSGLNISWMAAHGANGISAHRSLRDETVVIYIYLWQNYYSLLSPHISHSRFRKRRKGTSL